MFRSTKRKRTSTVRVSALQQEEEDSNDEAGIATTLRIPKQAANNKTRTTARAATSQTTQPKKFLQLPNLPNEEQSLTAQESHVPGIEILYDPDTLAQLQAAQEAPPTQDNNTSQPQPLKTKAHEPTPERVWTGDEALQLAQQLDDDPWNQDEDGDDDWERAVAQRAGILEDPLAASLQSSPRETHGRAEKNMEALQKQLTQWNQQLLHQNQQIDLTMERRKHELEQVQAQEQQHQQALTQHGKALEFYQQWRLQLVDWVNAMRHVNRPLQCTEQAMNELKADVAANDFQYQRQNDIVYELYKRSWLAECLGRQPPETLWQSQEENIDEFGRNKVSQQTLERQVRHAKMARIQQQRESMVPLDDASDAYLSDQEKETLRERHMALVEALEVTAQELDEEYIQLHNLVALFQEWHDTFPDDYVACYASLSLADLMSVLVRQEVCSLNDPWNESESFHEAKWTTVVFRAYSSGVMSEESIDRLLEKSVLPAVEDMLNHGGYNLVSSHQSRVLSTFYTRVAKIVPLESPALERLRGSFARYLEKYMQDITIPILKKDCAAADDDEEGQAILYTATHGQLRRLHRMLRNVLVHWGNLLGGDTRFVSFVLDFISNRFLVLVSSIQRMNPDSMQTVGDVCSWLQPLGVLDDDSEWALQTAPLRAAATVLSESRQC